MRMHPAYPRPWTNPIDLRPTAALEAAGAWDPTPTEQRCSGALRLDAPFTYTRGAAGGAVDVQLQVSYAGAAATLPAGAAEWITMPLYASGAVGAGADSQSNIQSEYVTFQPLTAVAENFSFQFEFEETVERVRIRARESGVVGTPGTLQITGILI